LQWIGFGDSVGVVVDAGVVISGVRVKSVSLVFLRVAWFVL
jgi:hypothetical protein